ncbi:probable tetraacyldisaccharide 4'-kinase, mitochondrial isoform X2 [Arachis ipaensis]|uniref:probable tetraacyldisaccharide 4'-kinase, mitochondrial isoform X2 n=1 Tax=Arachis ipaensis TaxID=130454 RepID=UPI000A2B2A59|nr:probable tetraacyldisaccharide 4'-kinase, mitochondrial isoform X2 [Arachis ipaensis]
MEKVRRAVNEIAYARNPRKLCRLHRSLIPLLSIASSLYKLALSLRHSLYRHGFFPVHRLPVAVVSVGNLSWGGNGKTPMVEFIARWLCHFGISPLILSRGYAGGDEVNMLRRHLLWTPTKFGVGANRAAVASQFIQRYGYVDTRESSWYRKQQLGHELNVSVDSENIGAVVLDDAMQVMPTIAPTKERYRKHWSLWRDLDIVMVNGLTLWGNLQLLPLGPLREPLTALKRADAVVIHHADLVSENILKDIESTIRGIKESIPLFFSKMDPTYLFEVGNTNANIPLTALHKATILCVSAIGSAESFVKKIQKMGACYVDRVDFSDHHAFHVKDIELIRAKLKELEGKFGSKPIVVITEKDYDRDPEILKQLYPFKTFVVCSTLMVMSYKGSTEDSFKNFLKDHLRLKFPAEN